MGKRKNTRDGVCVEEKSDPIEEFIRRNWNNLRVRNKTFILK